MRAKLQKLRENPLIYTLKVTQSAPPNALSVVRSYIFVFVLISIIYLLAKLYYFSQIAVKLSKFNIILFVPFSLSAPSVCLSPPWAEWESAQGGRGVRPGGKGSPPKEDSMDTKDARGFIQRSLRVHPTKP